jgi:hypothetical protein
MFKASVLTVLFLLTSVIVSAQTYVGGTFGIENSNNYFGETIPTYAVEAQKEFGNALSKSQTRIRAVAQLNINPRYPSIFQGDGTKFDGYEVRINPEVEYSPIKLWKIRPFVGAGVDYFHQSFPDEQYGKDAHFHSGLNPTASIGVTFGNTTVHRIAVTRVFEEPKFKTYNFYSFYSEDYYDPEDGDQYKLGDKAYFTTKGIFNPSYPRGWRLNYNFVKSYDDSHFKVIGGLGAEVIEFRKCLFTGRGVQNFEPYCAGYRERDVVIGARIGLAFGSLR